MSCLGDIYQMTPNGREKHEFWEVERIEGGQKITRRG